MGDALRQEEHEPFDIPDVLPLLPVRDLVVFPAQVVPLFVSREISLSAVEQALARERLVFVVAQRDASEESPQAPHGMYGLGTCCLILRQRKLPDGRIKVLVQGLVKATLEEVVEQQPCTRARLRKIHELPFEAQGELALEAEALGRSVKTHLEKLIATGRGISPEQLLVLSGVQDPGRLADLCASSLQLKAQEAQEILEQLDPVARLRGIHERLARESQLLAMQARLQSQAKEEISKTQREYYLREQLRQIQHELGERDEKAEMVADLRKKMDARGLPEHVAEEAGKELRRLEAMSLDSAEAAVLRSHLEWICELPWNKRTEEKLDLAEARRILDEDHHGLLKVKERMLEVLGVRKLKPEGRSPILLFLGPPGVGKTSLARSIARAMGRSYARISLGGVRDEAEIRGHRRTYVGALPGRILMGIKQAGTMNPVFVLDEVDKLGSDVRGDPSSALLEVLDPEQNHAFRDHYLNLDFDLSQVFFIATANTLDGIPHALRDRMEIVELSGYSEEEKLAIAEQHLLPKQRAEHGLTAEQIELPPATMKEIIASYTREAGVRELTRELAALCRKVALQIAEGKVAHARLEPRDLQKLLGVSRFDALATELEETVGGATGLAWTPWGGDILRVEVTAMRAGRAKGLILTGQLGAVMQESAQAALSYIRSRAAAWGVAADFFDQHDLHLHVPAGAIPKDGPSAGATMAAALASLLTGRPCRRRVAMTGEITLRGRILAVGGVREKLLAAARAGVETVCIPQANARELSELPASLQRKLEILTISTLDDLFAHALVGGAPVPRVAVATAG
ncbi:MAG: endopeptidase La [Deltaproteobacteria bacterium]|nr:MAG: endopeptidase La [Deltaproteobacteria bacterium]